jgi:hypothetical protein
MQVGDQQRVPRRQKIQEFLGVPCLNSVVLVQGDAKDLEERHAPMRSGNAPELDVSCEGDRADGCLRSKRNRSVQVHVVTDPEHVARLNHVARQIVQEVQRPAGGLGLTVALQA